MIRILSFLFIGISLLYGFLVWTFPYERVKRVFIQAVEESLPIHLSIERMGPSFPFALQLEKIEIQTGPVRLQLPDLRIRPDVGDFFQGRTTFYFRDVQNPERLQGKWGQGKNQNRLDLQLRHFKIEAFWAETISFPLGISGEAQLQWIGDEVEKGTGQGWALLERGRMEKGQNAQIPLPIRDYDTLRTELQISGGTLRLKRLEVTGEKHRILLPPNLQIPLSGGTIPNLGLFFPSS
jgi:type II secretion system protein N